MVRMAELAPKGVFEPEDSQDFSLDEVLYERHFDDYTRNYEEAA